MLRIGEVMGKREIRQRIITLRNNLTKEERKESNHIITKKIIKSDIYKNAKSIFIYVSYSSEVDTIEIINDALALNKEVYVPKIYKDKEEMEAVRIHNLDNMIVDEWGILEPAYVDKNLIGDKFDLIIMPGVAFDMKGNRIGYGGGYYDKYIDKYEGEVKLLALAFNIQIINNIESEPHDIKMDYIITEWDNYTFKN